MNILVTGAGGLLGSAFMTSQTGHAVIGVGRGALDVANPRAVLGLVAAHRADIVINCAADTDVDGAEKNPDRAVGANTTLAMLLATACRRARVLMVQISSTGCYGDWKGSPYVEEDELRPTTVYHRTKADGERVVREEAGESLILRTGWLYGGDIDRPRNFVGQRLHEARGKEHILGDGEQFGNPTLTEDLVRQTFHLIEAGVSGTFNCVTHGAVSRCEYVRSIIELAGMPCRVVTAPPGGFARPAPVSRNETAINRRLALLGLDVMPDWQVSLRCYVARLAGRG